MSKTTTDDRITEVKRLKKTIRNTRLSSILFVAALCWNCRYRSSHRFSL